MPTAFAAHSKARRVKQATREALNCNSPGATGQPATFADAWRPLDQLADALEDVADVVKHGQRKADRKR